MPKIMDGGHRNADRGRLGHCPPLPRPTSQDACHQRLDQEVGGEYSRCQRHGLGGTESADLVAAAVFVYRLLAWLAPIPIGGIAFSRWRDQVAASGQQDILDGFNNGEPDTGEQDSGD